MPRTLVTGATGLVGHALARLLVERGHRVRALVRGLERARAVLPPAVELIQGDLTDPPSLPPAVEGVEWVFHAAGLPEQWLPDPARFDRVNRQGTRDLLEAALRAGVRRVVHTSTMDVFAAPRGGTLVETRVDTAPKRTAYERSKVAAEREAEALLERGLDAVFVNPAAVYGPSPSRAALNGFFADALAGRLPLLAPGGMSIVFTEGLARAQLAAAERGATGERYLVADGYATLRDLYELIARHAGLERIPPVAPEWLVKLFARLAAGFARVFKVRPLVAPGELAFLLWEARIDSGKARRELGFEPTPLEEGVARTVAALRAEPPPAP